MTVESTTPTCFRHPQRETGLHCTRCGRSACHECLRPAPVGSHCLACLEDGQRSLRLVDAPWQARASGRGVPAIIATCVAVYLVQVTGNVEVRYSMIGALVAGGETYRLLTSMFLHFGLLHLAMNMLATWIFGLEVERSEGAVRTIAAFLVTGLVGGATAYLFHPPFAQVAGASGGVFGLLGVALILTIRSGRSAQAFVGLLLINLFIGIAVPNISLAAHAGGFVAGAIYGAAASAPPAARPKVLSLLSLVAMLAAVAYVVTSREPGILG